MLRRFSPARSYSFVTTPIFYVNAAPHIGHVYSVVMADALHRWNAMHDRKPAIFSTGTDEHGLKVQEAAAARKIQPAEFCTQVSQKFQSLFLDCDVSYTDYIRTTENRHLKVVDHCWSRLVDGGFIYKGAYEGWYVISDEMFVSNSQVREVRTNEGKVQTVSIESGNVAEWTQESNYMFKLTHFRDDLLHWLNSPGAVHPTTYIPIVKKWIDESLTDLSVSRTRERLQWGIPVPNDPSQTIYVWLDALINYLTVAGYPRESFLWPPTHQIVGKDILKFHAIYWPAFLIALGLDPPQSIVTHAHWTRNRTKMSKSKGNVVDPVSELKRYGVSALRYYLLKEGSLNHDGDYSDERMVAALNGDLADTLGNLLHRCTSPKVNPSMKIPRYPGTKISHLDQEMIDTLNRSCDSIIEHFNRVEFNHGLVEMFAFLHQANRFIEQNRPWDLVKDPAAKSRLDAVLSIALETLRLAGILLQPIVPSAANRLLNRLRIPEEKRKVSDATVCILNEESSELPLGESEGVLFEKI